MHQGISVMYCEYIKHQEREDVPHPSPVTMHSNLKLLVASRTFCQKLEDISLTAMCVPMRTAKEEPSELCHLHPRPTFKHEIKNK